MKTLRNRFSRLKELSIRLLQAAEQRGLWALFLYALAGSLLLPLPMDSVLSGLIIGSPKRWLRLTLAFASASVMGGLATYLIGYTLINLVGSYLIGPLGGQDLWVYLVNLLQSGEGTVYLATVSLVAGPYKLSMLAAGATGMKVSLIMLILLVTRTSRFFAIGMLTRFFSNWYQRLRELKANKLSNQQLSKQLLPLPEAE